MKLRSYKTSDGDIVLTTKSPEMMPPLFTFLGWIYLHLHDEDGYELTMTEQERRLNA